MNDAHEEACADCGHRPPFVYHIDGRKTRLGTPLYGTWGNVVPTPWHILTTSPIAGEVRTVCGMAYKTEPYSMQRHPPEGPVCGACSAVDLLPRGVRLSYCADCAAHIREYRAGVAFDNARKAIPDTIEDLPR